MNNVFTKLAATALFAFALGGCHLYTNDDGTYYYCDASGCYECDDFGCFTTVQGEGDRGAGSSCDTNSECDTGCYCGDNVCIEAGFCLRDGDCDPGYECQEDRNSCVPQTQTPPEDEFLCQASITSSSCSTNRPVCPVGSAAAIVDGCFTGECVANNLCADDNPCSSNTRAECEADEATGRCEVVFKGLNCTSSNGQPCDSASAIDCTCERFIYDECEAALN